MHGTSIQPDECARETLGRDQRWRPICRNRHTLNFIAVVFMVRCCICAFVTQDIFDLILRELRLGALALEHIVSKSSSRTGARGSTNRNDVAFDGDAKARPFAVGREVKQEMRRSYSHGHTQAFSCSMAWKGLNGADRVDIERKDASAQTLGLSALEIGEVEPHMFRQLALLCSVRQYAIARAQLAHPSALRSIFSLLKVGSPRIQR